MRLWTPSVLLSDEKLEHLSQLKGSETSSGSHPTAGQRLRLAPPFHSQLPGEPGRSEEESGLSIRAQEGKDLSTGDASHMPVCSEFSKFNNIWLYLQIACTAIPLTSETYIC